MPTAAADETQADQSTHDASAGEHVGRHVGRARPIGSHVPAPDAPAPEDGEPEPTQAALEAMAEAAEVLQDDVEIEQETEDDAETHELGGYRVVVAQRWPGSRNALVELLLIGSGGVFLVASQNFRPLVIKGRELVGDEGDVNRAVRALTNTLTKLEAELTEIGIAAGEIIPVGVTEAKGPESQPFGIRHGRIRVVGPEGLLPLIRSRGKRFTRAHVDAMVARLAMIFPDLADDDTPTNPPTGLDLIVVPGTETDEEGPEHLDVEPWMTFLTPEQSRIVARSFNGPARLRGAAGTGKTVVGLHRAARIATSEPGRVLVTSLVRTLPKVMEQHYARLSPETANKVDFSSVHRFALDVLIQRNKRTNIDLGAAALAFRHAWDKVGADSVLAQQGVPATYWQEEIDHVIKGRGVANLDEYLVLERLGRQLALKSQVRIQMWALFNAYQAELNQRGVHDLADMLLLADAELEREPWNVQYSAVIVDEAQDMSLVGVRMLHRLVGDIPDGFLLIADGQQGVTPGGFSMSEAGIDVVGRDALLRTNLRSDAAVGAVAHAVVAGTAFEDLDGILWHPDRELDWLREGGRTPDMIVAETTEAHDQALLDWVKTVLGESKTGADIAILAARHAQVGHYRKVLVANGIEVVDLDGYDGTQHAVKIGTMRRAKGLTFGNVALPQLRGDDLAASSLSDEGGLGAVSGGSIMVRAERLDRERREIFSAMCRATERLWLGYVH